MGKISKNARVAERAANAGSGKDFVKVIQSIKDPKSGKYTYRQVILHKDKVKSFFAETK